MKPNATPRTLSECQFTTGYSSASPARTTRADVLLAVAIGIALGAVLVFGLAS
jgi:hypothetical protein